MVIQEMTAPECRAMLAGRKIARLACARNNQPYVVPVQLDFDGEFFYGYSTVGLKVEWMRENPLVCLEIDTITSQVEWETVVVFGQYEELPATPDNEELRSVAEGLFQGNPMWWEPASVSVASHQPRSPVVFRIRITSVTGRRAFTDSPHT